jgi:hypothetical protein
MGSHFVWIRRKLLITLQQQAVKFTLQKGMPDACLLANSQNQWVHQGIKYIVAQNTIQVSAGSFAPLDPDGPADPGKEGFSADFVVFDSQNTGAGFLQGIVKKEQIRPVQPNVKQPAETLDGAAGVCRQYVQYLRAKAGMGIERRHTITSNFCKLSIANPVKKVNAPLQAYEKFAMI